MDDQKTFEAQGSEGKWYGQTLESAGVPMIDSKSGKPLVLRTFEFALKPSALGKERPDQASLFNFHWPQIKTIIWSDGLIENRDVSPRVIIGKKRYRIFVLCEPKFRTAIVERPTDLQTIFKKKLTK